jgi:MoxR-like ATPase
VDQALIALFTGGHCLITGVPGLAKTLLIKTLARDTRPELQAHPVHAGPDACRHHRDRNPGRGRRRVASLRQGTDLREDTAGRRDQPHPAQDAGGAAGGDAGAARDRRAAPTTLEEPFFVLATQNPIELEGTYPLPEAQLDRFMFKVVMTTCPRTRRCGSSPTTSGRQRQAGRVLGGRTSSVPADRRQVLVAEEVARYAVRLVDASRPGRPRASTSSRSGSSGAPGSAPRRLCYSAGRRVRSYMVATTSRWRISRRCRADTAAPRHHQLLRRIGARDSSG